MANRRGFLAGLLAASLIPKPTWADAGSPSFLAAGALPDGSFVLCGINAGLEVLFQIPLPSRGHAAAAHPNRPEAVAFARRPGTFAIVIDCSTGEQKAQLSSPEGRHFYGHGAFSQNGNWLFTTENDFEAGLGVIGIWDVTAGYKRVGEMPSGGIGPHEIKRMPGSDVLVIANGGIETHPEAGRTKLNIPTMSPNLAYIEGETLTEIAELSPDLHKNSIRHIAVSSTGLVAFGMQWQSDSDVVSLVGTHKQGAPAALLNTPPEHVREMQSYIGSIAFGADKQTIAVTSPRGGFIQTFDASEGQFIASQVSLDASGIAPAGNGFVVTSGTGALRKLGRSETAVETIQPVAWDNHLIPLTTS